MSLLSCYFSCTFLSRKEIIDHLWEDFLEFGILFDRPYQISIKNEIAIIEFFLIVDNLSTCNGKLNLASIRNFSNYSIFNFKNLGIRVNHY